MEPQCPKSECTNCGEKLLMAVLTDQQRIMLQRYSGEEYGQEDLVWSCENGHISGHVKCQEHDIRLTLRVANLPNQSPYPKYYSCFLPWSDSESCSNKTRYKCWFWQSAVQADFLSSQNGDRSSQNPYHSNIRSTSSLSPSLSSRLNMTDSQFPHSYGVSNSRYTPYLRGEAPLDDINRNEFVLHNPIVLDERSIPGPRYSNQFQEAENSHQNSQRRGSPCRNRRGFRGRNRGGVTRNTTFDCNNIVFTGPVYINTGHGYRQNLEDGRPPFLTRPYIRRPLYRDPYTRRTLYRYDN